MDGGVVRGGWTMVAYRFVGVTTAVMGHETFVVYAYSLLTEGYDIIQLGNVYTNCNHFNLYTTL